MSLLFVCSDGLRPQPSVLCSFLAVKVASVFLLLLFFHPPPPPPLPSSPFMCEFTIKIMLRQMAVSIKSLMLTS